MKAGTWASARGKVTITNADLAAMVAESRDPDLDAPPIKLGHVDPRFDGEPALGWVRNLRLSSDGATLIGDLTDVPASLADVIATAYPRRSIEAAWGMPKGDGTKRGAVLTGLALLGITPPAVKGLADVYRAAAAGEAVVTVMNERGAPTPVAWQMMSILLKPGSTGSLSTTPSAGPGPLLATVTM